MSPLDKDGPAERPIEADDFDVWSLEREERRANLIGIIMVGAILAAVLIVWWWRT